MNIWILAKKIRNKFIYHWYTPINKLCFTLNSVKYGKKLKVRGYVNVFKHYESASLIIGDNVSINSGSWANPIGNGTKTNFQLFRNGSIQIGNHCGISNVSFTSAVGIKIADNVMLGEGCKIYDTDFHPISYSERMIPGNPEEYINSKEVVIDEGVFVGAGTLILKGVHIGRHSVIGAGSVITKSVPENEIWAGNPAKFIAEIEMREQKD